MATGRAARERLERARDVSALIGVDATAGDAFGNAYTGRGNAVGALDALLRGDAADPDRDARLDRHRRSAFGRPAGPADEAAATAALVALRLEAESADADSEALDRAIDVVLERETERLAAKQAAAEHAAAAQSEDGIGDDSPASAAPAESTSAPSTRRWLRPVLAAAVIVAAIALGAGGGNLVSGALAGPEPLEAAPTPITYFRDPAVRDGEAAGESLGDTDAADRWFRSEQTPEDTYPRSFDDIDPGSTRVVHTGTDGWRVWVGRGRDGEYCLLAHSSADQSGISTCIAAEGFTRSGATLEGLGYNSATWTGADLTFLISRR